MESKKNNIYFMDHFVLLDIFIKRKRRYIIKLSMVKLHFQLYRRQPLSTSD